MITIEYNGISHKIPKNEQLTKLLKRKNLLALPMSKWVELINKKSGVCESHVLYNVMLSALEFYDKSQNVNSFIYKDKHYWLDKNTRLGLQQLVNSSEDKISLVLEDEIIELSIDAANKFLKDLEVYAGKCYLNTQKHLLNIKSLETLEDMINYDYTSGYPEKIVLNG